MKSKVIAILLLAGTSLFARVNIAIGVGAGYPVGYYAPPPAAYYAPAPVYARPGYVWVNGYQYPVGSRWVWREGYWARPPYAGARWVAPRYYGGRYYAGYWRR